MTDQLTDSSPVPLPSGLDRRRSNLQPPWPKGASANPGGVPKDPTRRVRRYQKTLFAEVESLLQENRGEKLKALAQSLIEGAQAREPIPLRLVVERIWPVPQESPSASKVVFTGVRLEMPDGTTVQVAQGEKDVPPTLGETCEGEPAGGAGAE